MTGLRGAPLLVALVVGLGLTPAVVRADTAPSSATPPPPEAPRALVVGLALANPSLQAGVVRGRDVILARGFEVELARVLARRLGGRVEGFLYTPAAPRLPAASLSGWHVALGGIARSAGPHAVGDVSRPYLTTDLAVVLRRGLPAPRRLADLRSAVLCAMRGSEAAETIGVRIRPSRPPLVVAGLKRLRDVLRTGACDAALVPALEAGRFVAGQRRLLGPVAGRVEHGGGYAILVRRGTGLAVAAVDRELGRLTRDGTLGRLARTWLGVDPAALRVLR